MPYAVVGWARRAGGEDPELFDAGFFDLRPGEAEAMDPRHRIFLERAWEALEDAGYDPRRIPGRVGVFAASAPGAGELVSRTLGLSGPIVTVQDLSPLHLAMRSLLDGDADMALAGDGAGLVVLKRLEAALAEGDTVRVVLEMPPEPAREPSRPWQAVVLSARSESALEAATAGLADFLRRHPETDLGDAAYTLQVGRRLFERRRFVVARDVPDALAVLDGSDGVRVETFAGGERERPVSFLLPGFGDHYPDMALGLYRDQPAFRRIVDDCCERLRP